MKRDMDFVRDLLLQIEDLNNPKSDDLTRSDADAAWEEKLNDHLIMLVDEAGFLRGRRFESYSGTAWLDLGVTWQGHEYLEKIRDPEIWKKTKAGAEKVGSFGVDVLGALAKGFIKKKLSEHTGVEIDL